MICSTFLIKKIKFTKLAKHMKNENLCLHERNPMYCIVGNFQG